MSRITLPISIINWFILFGKTKAKHDADAAASVLIPYLAEQDIDLDVDETAVDDAGTAHTDFLQLEKDCEALTEKRNNLFKVVFSDHKKCVQFLKKLFRSAVHKLGDWGVTVNGAGKVVYKADFLECAIDIGLFITKHDSYAAGTSPLQPFLDENSIDLAANSTKLSNAVSANEDFDTKDEAKEEKRELRDELLNPVIEHLEGIGQFLVGLYTDLPHTAGKWGFEIDSSPQDDVIRKYTLSAGGIETIKNVALNSEVVNESSVTVYLKPANKPDATPFPLEAGKKFKVVYGYGSLKAENSSGTSEAIIRVTQNK